MRFAVAVATVAVAVAAFAAISGDLPLGVLPVEPTPSPQAPAALDELKREIDESQRLNDAMNDWANRLAGRLSAPTPKIPERR